MSEETNHADPNPASQDQDSPLWARLKEHRVAQWSTGYVAVAYGIQHAVTLTIEAMDWPHEIERASMILLALGLPVAITLSWYRGERASRRISAGELSIVSVLLVIASLLFYILVRPERAPTTPAAVAAMVASAPVPSKATNASVPVPSGPSVAVLPFLNLSGDPQQEYFSDGMTEEITAALAQVKGLRVIGRTSAFAFKGKNEDIRVIGQALGATEVIEGSVRKAGDQLRITAQLIKVDDDSHVWAQSYDRELKDVFAVQEDVATAIAGALQVPLGLKQGESLVSNRDIDPESYQNYLRAQALVSARGGGGVSNFSAPIALLEQVVARQPNYAPAWALLAQAYILAPAYQAVPTVSRSTVDANLSKAEAADRRAIQLDPRNADAYEGLGQIQAFRGKLLDAEESFKQALRLDPLNPDALHHYSLFLTETDQLKQAVAMREQLRTLEPLIPVFNLNTALILSIAGDNAQALPIAETLPNGGSGARAATARIYASMGQYKDAAGALMKIPSEAIPHGVVEAAARLLRMSPTTAMGENIPNLGRLSWVFAYAGLPERSLEYAEQLEGPGIGFFNVDTMIWSSNAAAAAVRKTERFKTLVRELGLVDYWRAKGWPDLCHPTTGDDFGCN